MLAQGSALAGYSDQDLTSHNRSRIRLHQLRRNGHSVFKAQLKKLARDILEVFDRLGNSVALSVATLDSRTDGKVPSRLQRLNFNGQAIGSNGTSSLAR